MTRRPALAMMTILLAASIAVGAPADTIDPPARIVVGLAAGTAPPPFPGARIVDASTPLDFVVYETPDPAALLGAAAAIPGVRYAERDDPRPLLHLTPNDPSWSSQYAPENVGLPQAWDTTTGSTQAAVCIIDTGARLTHVDLAGARYQGGYDFIEDDTTPQDGHGHGTHVLGIAAAGVDNGLGIAGAANVAFYVARVLDDQGDGTLSDIAEGIAWCSARPDARLVISMSLGCSTSAAPQKAAPHHGTGESCDSQAVRDAVSAAQAAGRILVVSAGNDGPCYSCVAFPARLDGIVSIGCTASDERACWFSSTGPQLAIAAPGNNIVSLGHASDTALATSSGTSMSAPLVAGITALYWSHDTTIHADALRARLLGTAQPLGDPGHDRIFGCGEVDATRLFAGGGSCTITPEPFCDGVPANDCRADPIELTSSNGHIITSLAQAHDERDEPHPCDIGNTLWYRFTPSRNGTAWIHMTETGYPNPMDELVAVYETPLGGTPSLTTCHEITHAGWFGWNCVAGRTYELQVGGWWGERGTTRIALDLCPIGGTGPLSVNGLTAMTGPSRGEVRLSWSAPDWDGGVPRIGYEVKRGPDCSSLTPLATTSQTSLTDLASEGATYCYHVAAAHADGAHPGITILATPLGVPPPPRALTSLPGDSAISLSWQPPAGDGGSPITSYLVFGASSPSGPFSLLMETSATSFTETDLAPGTTRYHHVASVNVHGFGPESETVSATAVGTPGAPQHPGASVTNSRGSLRVNWSAAPTSGAPITQYHVYAAGPGGSFTLVGTTIPEFFVFTHAGLPDNATRRYVVRAMSSVGEGPASAEVNATTYAIPGAPTNLVASTTSPLPGVRLTWNAPAFTGSGVKSYDILRASSETGTYTKIGSSAQRTFTDDDVVAGRSFYRIRAVNPAGVGAPSVAACGSHIAIPLLGC